MDTVREFWQAHVNNEYYTDAERASDAYFGEIEQRRYHTHYHLPELFASLDGAGPEPARGRLRHRRRQHPAGQARLPGDRGRPDRERPRRWPGSSPRSAGSASTSGSATPRGWTSPTQSFDVVYSFGVLHHTPDIERSVAEVHRVLRPGGTAYVMLYHRYSLVNLVHRVLRLPYESPRDRKDHCPVVYTFSRRRRPQAVPRVLRASRSTRTTRSPTASARSPRSCRSPSGARSAGPSAGT